MKSVDREGVLQIIEDAIEEFNALEVSADRKLVFSEDTILLGRQGRLKSIDLVRLIIEIEFKLEEIYGMANVLTSEKAMSQKSSPFRTIKTMTDYICSMEVPA